MIAFGIGGAGLIGMVRNSHKHDGELSESIDDNTRLQQLISISGGGSLAQLTRLFKIRGKQLEAMRKTGCRDKKFRGYFRDSILLA